MSAIVQIEDLTKRYDDGKLALKNLSVEFMRGEIIALLGPNGAGKTSLISIICGLTTISDGLVTVDGFDIQSDYREARSLIGLVPQELMLEPFETVMGTVSLSRGLFGQAPNDAYVEDLLSRLSLWEKRDSPIRELSGGMKRRVLIAKALSHEPKILFLDEPTAGVDVDLRHDMWRLVKDLQDEGVTVILTTHYIEEAEEIADRIAVINEGQILLVEDKSVLMNRLGKKELLIELSESLIEVPQGLAGLGVRLQNDGRQLSYSYNMATEKSGIPEVLGVLKIEGIGFSDVHTEQSSLEDIFIELVAER
ncbi:MAG: ABC transporter ATP-binding protein [Pseudomonadota bacterium]|nr:ABC transporter ATP-binding protein [Pseudomonadota bacterium]